MRNTSQSSEYIGVKCPMAGILHETDGNENEAPNRRSKVMHGEV